MDYTCYHECDGSRSQDGGPHSEHLVEDIQAGDGCVPLYRLCTAIEAITREQEGITPRDLFN